jgi:release factor glutamine methyltransferase
LPTLLLADVVAALRAAGCVFAEDEAGLLVEAASAAEDGRRPDGAAVARADGPRSPDLAALLARRVAGEPLEHVLGWAKFCGRRIAVDPGVFVPRRRTELLVHLAAAVLAPGAVVVELCCGAAAVATVLAATAPGLAVHAVDVDPAAVRCAWRNLAPFGGHVYAGDLDAPLPAELRGRVDLVVANAPYVPTEAIALMPPEARDHEPAVALDGGADGLDVQRRVIAAAPRWLRSGGHLLIETSARQAPLTSAAMVAVGLLPRVERDEDRDGTAVVGIRP